MSPFITVNINLGHLLRVRVISLPVCHLTTMDTVLKSLLILSHLAEPSNAAVV